mmetsp:Transcript_37387/g.60534  ORF Transcript_37387/g.60534 Transcript_37387/m.60534 type:complete len:210 (-) Transcript_37387:123-752(-)|eukprot:CAMPEP_0184660758 /NCGR_PEP_ID=MMETSP0308-20130426/35155_1 /TAXON_ID=38269 /ORGANISM="Gloeochaete witrockiana, Strain SAG 46.84" /LENGTH=209 /DNA_ID=CAMNT_0027101581 /DNA_START=165 /DNA_END=794 /DNA_ORIENTATION=+
MVSTTSEKLLVPVDEDLIGGIPVLRWSEKYVDDAHWRSLSECGYLFLSTRALVFSYSVGEATPTCIHIPLEDISDEKLKEQLWKENTAIEFRLSSAELPIVLSDTAILLAVRAECKQSQAAAFMHALVSQLCYVRYGLDVKKLRVFAEQEESPSAHIALMDSVHQDIFVLVSDTHDSRRKYSKKNFKRDMRLLDFLRTKAVFEALSSVL